MGQAPPQRYCQERCNEIVWSRWGKAMEVAGRIPSFHFASCETFYQVTGTDFPKFGKCACIRLVLRNVESTATPHWGRISQTGTYQPPTFEVNYDGTITPTSAGFMYPEYTHRQTEGAPSATSKTKGSLSVLLLIVSFIKILQSRQVNLLR